MKNSNDKTYLDKLNKDRYENTKNKCNKVFKLADKYTFKNNLDDINEFQKDISKAISLLEVAEEEMNWHCEYFDYNNSVCLLINDVCLCFGRAIIETNEEEHDFELTKCNLKDGLIILSKVIANLVLWYEDENCENNET